MNHVTKAISFIETTNWLNIMQEQNFKNNFYLQWYQLIHAIPKSCKKNIKK